MSACIVWEDYQGGALDGMLFCGILRKYSTRSQYV